MLAAAVLTLAACGQQIPAASAGSGTLSVGSPAIEFKVDAETPVLGVSVGAAARAYPLLALLGPEVVNDELDGTPLVVTF